MPFREIAREVWEKAHFLSFLINDEPTPFSNDWFAKNYPDLACGKDSRKHDKLRGWYWIVTNLSNKELQGAATELPTEERRKRGSGVYLSIGDRASGTLQNVGENVCTTEVKGLRVVYNGHEGWARGRLGGHYKSLDPRTGALRVSQHPQLRQGGKWGAAIFTEEMIPCLSQEHQNLAARLVASKQGRTVVEMEWRSCYGWPILCLG